MRFENLKYHFLNILLDRNARSIENNCFLFDLKDRNAAHIVIPTLSFTVLWDGCDYCRGQTGLTVYHSGNKWSDIKVDNKTSMAAHWQSINDQRTAELPVHDECLASIIGDFHCQRGCFTQRQSWQ